MNVSVSCARMESLSLFSKVSLLNYRLDESSNEHKDYISVLIGHNGININNLI